MFNVPIKETGALSLGDLGSIGGQSAVPAQSAPPVQNYAPVQSAPPPIQPPAPAAPIIGSSGGGVRLKKGQKISLSDYSGGGALTNITVGIGWDLRPGVPADLDVSVFCLDSNNRCAYETDFVFYGNLSLANGSVRHSGDSTDGASAGDDEQIFVSLPNIEPRITRLAFVITNTVNDEPQNFSAVTSAYARVVNGSNGQELFRFELSQYAANVTALMIGELYNYNGVWKFNTLGEGKENMGLLGLCGFYGVPVSD